MLGGGKVEQLGEAMFWVRWRISQWGKKEVQVGYYRHTLLREESPPYPL